jgi:hypothetical protein
VRRIGRVMGGDTGLLGTLTGSPSGPRTPSSSAPDAEREGGGADEPAPLADVVALPSREQRRSARRQRDL